MQRKKSYNAKEIRRIKDEIENDELLKKQIENLREEIEEKLSDLKYSVVDKEMIPASGNKHDYYSIGIYAWPNPETKDGLPWILDDCKANPYVKTMASDSIRIERFCNDIMILTVLYYIYEEKKYLDKIIELLNEWFINKETKMNPNMNYAQAIPGVCTGRGIGLIDARQFIKLITFIEVLEEDRLIDKNLLNEMREWFKEFITWMEESDNGKDEEASINNHGSWYEAELTTFALFIGEKEKVKSRLGRFIEKIKTQITFEGNQPLEIQRKKSWHYFIFNLEAMFIGFRNLEYVLNNNDLVEVKSLLKNALEFMIKKHNKNDWENKNDIEFFISELRERKFLPILFEMTQEEIIEVEKIEEIEKIANMTRLEKLLNTQNDYTILFPLVR